jgi:hypothetical protein
MGRKARASCAARLLLTVPVLLIAGCAGATVESPPLAPQGMACVDDSQQCIGQRMVALKGLMSDREKRWIRQPATPEAYASGVRLFAFKGRKKDLTCEELGIGKREADAGPATLRGAASRLTPAQISRGAMLAGEVGKELGMELRRRCKA